MDGNGRRWHGASERTEEMSVSILITYRGFAFGFGIDRLAMLKWGIDDIRLMHSADLRFVNQF